MNNYLPSVSGSSTTKGRRAKRKSNLYNSLIRVINKRLAHLNGVGNFSYKCLHSMRADCKYWSYGRNTTHRCIYIPWQCSGNRTTGPEHRGRHPCRAWRNRHDDLLLRQWGSIPREPSHDLIKCKIINISLILHENQCKR